MMHRGLVSISLSIVVVAVSTVVVAVSTSAVSASKGATPRCLGADATIVGTSARETIRGTDGADVIVGGGGSDRNGNGDRIFGLGGDDRICVDPSDPVFTRIRAGSGDDQVSGSAVMVGGLGADMLIEPAPVYTDAFLVGGSGDDLLRSRATDISYFVPGPGDDTLVAKVGKAGSNIHNEVDFGGARRGVVVDLRRGTAVGQGSDVMSGVNSAYGSMHADVIRGTGGSNSLHGRKGDDVLVGRGRSDLVEAGKGDDRLEGGPGDDPLFGDAGRDTLSGRAGNDELVEQRPEPNLILAGPGRDRCYGGYRVPPNIERGCERHRPSREGTGPLPGRLDAGGSTRQFMRAFRVGFVPAEETS